MKIVRILVLAMLSLPVLSFGQANLTQADYARAVSYLWQNIDNKTAFNLSIQPHWFSDSTGLWFVHQNKEEKEYRKLNLKDYKISPLFDHSRVASALSELISEDIDAAHLPFRSIEYKNSHQFIIKMSGKEFLLDITNYSVTEEDNSDINNSDEFLSPDSSWIAYQEDHNLFIKSTNATAVKQLSSDGSDGYTYGSYYGWYDIMTGENAQRPDHFYVDWAKSSNWIYASICDTRIANKMYLLDWSIDSLYRPNLLSYYRGSPGDTTMIYMEPVFFNATTGKGFKPKNTRATHINSTDVSWSDKDGFVYLLRTSRGYQEISLSLLNLNTGKEELLYKETSETNIDNFSYIIEEESNTIFFLSEKSGWRQLYSLDLGKKKEMEVTRGDFYINEIAHVDNKNKKLYFLASGTDDEENPYHQQLYSISFNGKGLANLTPEKLHHQISISPDGNTFVDNQSSAVIPTQTVLRSLSTGKILAELGRADISGLVNWSPPQIFKVIARDDKTAIYGALWKPSNFNPDKKYPIIDHSYTGPHTQMFPKDYRRVLALSNQALAELGFIVMMVDGLGSSGRSKSFHNYSYKNLGGNLEDHVGAIRQLATEYSWIDSTRVGIFGHSAGGYDAGHALLAYPDFYKVGVASSADHDHRMEKAWWPEMYMGWPVDSAYHLQSNITMAGNLKGKLLITHGGIDDNVNPSATFKLAEALIKADKQFDMLILPSQRHGYAGVHQRYFVKTRWNYFVSNLLGKEPIWDFSWE